MVLLLLEFVQGTLIHAYSDTRTTATGLHLSGRFPSSVASHASPYIDLPLASQCACAPCNKRPVSLRAVSISLLCLWIRARSLSRCAFSSSVACKRRRHQIDNLACVNSCRISELCMSAIYPSVCRIVRTRRSAELFGTTFFLPM